MISVKYNMATKCDSAGRSGNEDAYAVIIPGTRGVPGSSGDMDASAGANDDRTAQLGPTGIVLVVADGMGGMNAGDVASAMVVDGLRKRFASVPPDIASDEQAVQRFIDDAVTYADSRIKDYAAAHPASRGMGSTLTLLWLLGDRAYVAWVGDSRVYRYNPNNRLARLSHDHSYVQELVDDGLISEQEAFSHPDSNIITRSVGDNKEDTVVEQRVYDIFERDTFLLCSDGLCGLLDDEALGEEISRHSNSSADTLAALWQTGCAARWTDNVTMIVVNIEQAPSMARGIPQEYASRQKAPTPPIPPTPVPASPSLPPECGDTVSATPELSPMQPIDESVLPPPLPGTPAAATSQAAPPPPAGKGDRWYKRPYPWVILLLIAVIAVFMWMCFYQIDPPTPIGTATKVVVDDNAYADTLGTGRDSAGARVNAAYRSVMSATGRHIVVDGHSGAASRDTRIDNKEERQESYDNRLPAPSNTNK